MNITDNAKKINGMMVWYDVDIFKTNNNYKTFLNHFMKYLNAY